MGEGPVPQPQQKLTILEEQLGLLMIFDVVHLGPFLTGSR
jgi:hypothetical protein